MLGGALIALIALAYAYQGPLKKWQDNLGKPKNILSAFDAAKLDKIEIGAAAVILEKQGNRWKTNLGKDFYADPEAISRLFSELSKASASDMELVSNSRERKNEFNTSDNGLTVKIYQAGKPLAEFVVGRRSGDYAATYVSGVNSAATYAVKADLFGAFNPADWRDPVIFSTDRSKINKIRFQYPNREFTVQLAGENWSGVLPFKFSVNPDKIAPILGLMSDLKAAKIPEQSFSGTGLEKHLIIIEASDGGEDYILMVGQEKDGLYYAKRGDSDNVYLISGEQRDQLDKWIWQLQ